MNDDDLTVWACVCSETCLWLLPVVAPTGCLVVAGFGLAALESERKRRGEWCQERVAVVSWARSLAFVVLLWWHDAEVARGIAIPYLVLAAAGKRLAVLDALAGALLVWWVSCTAVGD